MKDDRPYLHHVRDAIARVRLYTAAGRDDFFADLKTQDAVIRNLEIMGEAVKQISTATTDKRPDIPWKQIAGDARRADPSLLWRKTGCRLGIRPDAS